MADRVVHFVLFPGVTILDTVGPLTVLRRLPAPYRTIVVAERLEPMDTDSGLIVAAEQTLAAAPRPFAVIVPGGPGTVAAMGDDVLLGYLQAQTNTADVIASVCTGSLVLAAAGFLRGRRATTHWAYSAELERLGATYVRERWVEDGKFITAAGISAGIDLALALAARFTDAATAQRIQLAIEYDPQPPFGGIRWDQVGAADLNRQRQTGFGKQLREHGDDLLAHKADLLRRLRS